MENAHPDDADLLGYVDDELARDRRRRVSEHVTTCAECSEAIAKLEAGRDALRAAPLLKLPATMRERVTMTLDRFEPETRVPQPRTYVSPMRLATVLVPVALALVLIVSIAELGDDDGGREAGRPSATQPAGDEAAGGDSAEGGGAEAAPEQATPTEPAATTALQRDLEVVTLVAGPPRGVVAVLRSRGFTARVETGTLVVVTGAEAAEVAEALEGRAQGRVQVAVEP